MSKASRREADWFPLAKADPGSSGQAAQPVLADQDDAKLFLEYMARPCPPAGRGRPSGFLLADLCALPALKSCRKPLKAAPAEKPAPAPPVADEIEAFLLGMGGTRPLARGSGRDVARAARVRTRPKEPGRGFAELLQENLEFSMLYSDEYLEGHVIDLDETLLNRLRAGQMSPEAHLDLHGLNSCQAFEAMRAFFRSAWFKGLRVVLLVPGRGLNSPNGQSILRQKLQTWLTQEPFKRIVLAFCTARPHDGGPGSIYVLLRKFRKKGRIYWDRLPQDPDLY